MSDLPRAIPTPIPDVKGAALALAEVVDTYWDILVGRDWHPSKGSASRARDYIQYHVDRYRDACSAAAAIERPDR